MDNAETTGVLIISSASVGYFIAWLIPLLHQEVVLEPLVQRTIKYALWLLLIVDALASIGIYAATERSILDSLWVIQALPLYLGVLASCCVLLGTLGQSRDSRLLGYAIRLLLWLPLIACSLMALLTVPIWLNTGLSLLSLILGFVTVVSAVIVGYSAKTRAEIFLYLVLRIDATALFFLGNALLLAFVTFKD